jgi:hypothetical protein
MNSIEKLKEAKAKANEELLQAILADSKMSKLEKLQAIDECDILPYKSWLAHPLEEKYADVFKKQIDDKFGKQDFHIIDGWPTLDCDAINRSQKISLANELECAYENVSYEYRSEKLSDQELEAKEIVILTNRSRDSLDEYKITLSQLVDDVYDWCVTNRKIGFCFDW